MCESFTGAKKKKSHERERKFQKVCIIKSRKYFYDKCTKLLTKRKKYATMLFGQERSGENPVKTARNIVTK